MVSKICINFKPTFHIFKHISAQSQEDPDRSDIKNYCRKCTAYARTHSDDVNTTTPTTKCFNILDSVGQLLQESDLEKTSNMADPAANQLLDYAQKVKKVRKTFNSFIRYYRKSTGLNRGHIEVMLKCHLWNLLLTGFVDGFSVFLGIFCKKRVDT